MLINVYSSKMHIYMFLKVLNKNLIHETLYRVFGYFQQTNFLISLVEINLFTLSIKNLYCHKCRYIYMYASIRWIYFCAFLFYEIKLLLWFFTYILYYIIAGKIDLNSVNSINTCSQQNHANYPCDKFILNCFGIKITCICNQKKCAFKALCLIIVEIHTSKTQNN